MKFLILEDEIHNFKLLQHMLLELYPGCSIEGPLSSIQQAQDFLSTGTTADIIIADIQLNDGLSFDALRNMTNEIPIVFTTAYDEYALRAFKFNSLSYLLKPIDEAELAEAIEKAQRLMTENTHYKTHFIVKHPRGEKIIRTKEIRYIASEQKITYLKLSDNHSYIIDQSLDALAKELDPSIFMRVNRKFIVSIHEVSELESISNGKKQLRLKGEQSPTIIISRERKNEVLQWIRGNSL